MSLWGHFLCALGCHEWWPLLRTDTKAQRPARKCLRCERTKHYIAELEGWFGNEHP